MTYDEYWFGNVWAVESFREAYEIRKKMDNYGYWLQGMYVYDGVSVSISNAMSKKGSTPKRYPSEPYDLLHKEKTEEERLQEEETDRLKAKLYMQNMVRAGRSWGK